MKKMIAIYTYDDEHKDRPVFALKENEHYEAIADNNLRYKREEIENNKKWFVQEIEMDENVAKLFE